MKNGAGSHAMTTSDGVLQDGDHGDEVSGEASNGLSACENLIDASPGRESSRDSIGSSDGGLEDEDHDDEVRREVNNGSSALENVIDCSPGRDSIGSSNRKVNEAGNIVASPTWNEDSPLLDSGSSPIEKGYGLRKWRRIRRDSLKEGSTGVDFGRALKRGLSNAAEVTKVRGSLSENLNKSERRTASPSPLMGNAGLVFSSSPLGVLDSDSTIAAISGFSAGTESDNGEDKSSRSMLARNKMKQKPEVFAATGSSRERSKAKNPGVKIHGNSVVKGQQGKSKIESCKKIREEKNFAEKENSYSSVESDVRNLDSHQNHLLFGSGQNNYKNHPEKYSSDQENEFLAQSPGLREGAQTDYLRNRMEGLKNWGGLAASILKEVNKNESRNSRSKSSNPLNESLGLLISAQEALQKEIQSFKEIGKDSQSDGNDGSLSADNINTSTRTQELNSGQLHFEEMEGSNSPPIDTDVAELSQRVSLLENLLEEKEEVIKAKDAKLLDLTSSERLLSMEGNDSVNALSKIDEAMIAEYDQLFMNRMEAEIEFIALTKTTQIVKEEQLSLLVDQKSLAEEQELILLKLEDTNGKAALLKLEAEKVEASSKELIRANESLKLQKQICKLSFLWFFQAFLFYLAFSWFLQLMHQSSNDIVPT